jgi:lipoyl(octanoyl) transferase
VRATLGGIDPSSPTHRLRALRPPQAGYARTVTELRFQTPGFGADAVEYLNAWELQRQVHQEVVDGAPDTVLLLEHPPVFTAGKRTEPHERPFDGTPVVDVDRGGKITFHGPGQLVGYPIVRLPDHVKVVDYVRRVEEALILACRDFGLTTARVPGRTGVWLQADAVRPERKIAAIGIRVSRGVTMHGFALNCDVDLGWYDKFVPCGITDAGVTSLSAELGRDFPVAEAVPVVSGHLEELLGWAPYTPTPDYEPRPDPARSAPELRVPVLNPLR